MTYAEFQVQQRKHREVERRRTQAGERTDAVSTPTTVSTFAYMMNLERRRTVNALRTVASSSRQQRRRRGQQGGVLRGARLHHREQPQLESLADAELRARAEDSRYAREDAPEDEEEAEERLRMLRWRARRGLVISDEEGTQKEGEEDGCRSNTIPWLELA